MQGMTGFDAYMGRTSMYEYVSPPQPALPDLPASSPTF